MSRHEYRRYIEVFEAEGKFLRHPWLQLIFNGKSLEILSHIHAYCPGSTLTRGLNANTQLDQINREYKIKALQLHPDKNPDPECVEKFRRIQEAKEVLTDVASRKLYDTWLNSGINIPFAQFQAKKGHSMHWAPPRRNVPLGIRAGKSFEGQGSESIIGGANQTNKTDASSLLDKFRKYEI